MVLPPHDQEFFRLRVTKPFARMGAEQTRKNMVATLERIEEITATPPG